MGYLYNQCFTKVSKVYTFQGIYDRIGRMHAHSSSHSLCPQTWQQASSIKGTLDCYYSLRNWVSSFLLHLKVRPSQSEAVDTRHCPPCSGKSQGKEHEVAAGQTGRRSVTSCPLSASLFSYHCAATLFSDPLQFSIRAEKNPIWKNFTIITRGSV